MQVTTRTALGTGLAALALLVPAAVAAPAASASAAATSAAASLSPNVQRPLAPSYYSSAIWSGWIDQAKKNVHLNYVSARFTIPTVSCLSAGRDVYFWVGLGGWGTRGAALEQAGVLADCIHKGESPQYNLWWEIWPKYLPHPERVVSSGETVVATARYDEKNHKYYFAVKVLNEPKADSFSTPGMLCPSYPGYTCNTSTAEVITEDPGGGPAKHVYLAKFHTVNFSSVKVITSAGVTGKLTGTSRWSAAKVTMSYHGKLMAQPSGRTDGGRAFSVTYVSGGG